ncbi:MAG: hypothetical protein D9V47_04270 [Clostridia bacterium]|nr:MAG: hypothetical protein D9V47_04270 [Clostridia bacterium]
MEDVRCTCHKIICQVEGNEIIIKCRHCKRYVVIRMGGPPVAMETRLEDSDSRQNRHLVAL